MPGRGELDLTDPALASDYTGYSASGEPGDVLLDAVAQTPRARAPHLAPAMSGGNFPGHGAFLHRRVRQIFPWSTRCETRSSRAASCFAGYPIVIEAGRYYALFNAEYRFPIVNIDRGMSSLPLLFLNRISGNVFVDYGSAFDDAYTAKFKTGTGAELVVRCHAGLHRGIHLRLGYARGLASEESTRRTSSRLSLLGCATLEVCRDARPGWHRSDGAFRGSHDCGPSPCWRSRARRRLCSRRSRRRSGRCSSA